MRPGGRGRGWRRALFFKEFPSRPDEWLSKARVRLPGRLPENVLMNRFLSVITPGRGATSLGIAIAILAFGMGLLEMLSRDYPAAQFHLYLSMGVLAYIIFLKYFSVHATHTLAEKAHRKLRSHIRQRARPTAPQAGEADGTPETEAERLAREKAEMAQLASDLRQALEKIRPDSPARPKYEATVELIERVLEKQQAAASAKGDS